MDLSNPYGFSKPPARILLCVPLLIFFMWLLHRYSGFYFAYQYALAVVLTLLAGMYFDKNVISRNRLSGPRSIPVDRISIFISPIAVTLILLVGISYIWKTSVFYPLYSSQGGLARLELFPLLVIVVVPMTEILFRGFFQFNITYMMGKNAGLVITTTLNAAVFYFAVMNFVGFVAIIALSGYLSYLYFKYESVMLTILSHEVLIMSVLIFRF